MILMAILVLGVMGLVFAGLLGFAADYFRVEEDPRVGQILAVLPGGELRRLRPGRLPGLCGKADPGRGGPQRLHRRRRQGRRGGRRDHGG